MSKTPRKAPKSSGLQLGRAVECRIAPKRRNSTVFPIRKAIPLRGPLHRAGIHLALPSDGPAGFRASMIDYVPGRWLLESNR